jgi:hypothetical protein
MKALASLIGVVALAYAGTASATPGGFTLANVLFRDNSFQQGRFDFFDHFRRDRFDRHHGNHFGHGHDDDHDGDHGHGHGNDHHGHDHGHGHGPGHGGGHCHGHHDDFCGPASP